jgi:DNA replication protein DnaC
VRKGGQVLFWEQRELLKALQGTYDDGVELREAEVLSPVLDAELLVLDDLGAGRTTPWARDVMHDVIAHRYNRQKLMLVTSNLATGDEEAGREAAAYDLERSLSLRERLGDALMSRIYEMCQLVRIEGKDVQDFRQTYLSAQHRR